MDRKGSNRLLDLRMLPELDAMNFEKLLASTLRDVLSELFYTNAGILMTYINAGKTNIIDDILASSSERSLKPGMLRYGQHATTFSDWGTAPTVTIDMELHHPELCTYFKIIFDERAVGVHIDSIFFTEDVAEVDNGLSRFASALTDARITHS